MASRMTRTAASVSAACADDDAAKTRTRNVTDEEQACSMPSRRWSSTVTR